MASTITAQGAQEVNTTTAGDQRGTSTAALADGGHVVAWNSNGNVLLQFFDAGGARSGDEITALSGYSLGDICQLADGSLVVSATRSWSDASGPHSEAYYERLSASGTILVPPTLVDGSGNYDVWVSAGNVYATQGGGFGVTDIHTTRPTPLSWIDTTIRLYDAGGADTGVGIPGTNGFFQGISQMPSGGFAVAGNTNIGPGPSKYNWRTVDAAGNAIAGQSFEGVYGVNDYQAGGVTTLADGRTLVTWQFITYGYKGVGNPVWNGQWLDSSGHAIGGTFALGFDVPYNAKFTALADGGVLATWTQQTGYGLPYELYAQHLDASANADSDAVHLASLPSNTNYGEYEITALATGDFLLTSPRTGDGLDVWEQLFDVSSGASTSTGARVDVHGGITPIGDGEYMIYGDAGLDQIALASAHTGWSVDIEGSTATLTGPGGTNVLTGVERVRFNDGYAVALDVDGDAGQAYRLYQAAFDRAPDLPGLGFQMNDLDMGYSLVHVAQNFIDSPEFQATYGPGLSNTEFITLLYRNVLNREPEAAGLQYHLDEFAHGDTRAAMLTHFSESPENQANVIGAIQDGMLYVPYA
jgi:hypothetical protein